MTMMFDISNGELNPINPNGMLLNIFENWTPYYNLEGKYAGYRSGLRGTGYYHPEYGYVLSYEDLDW